MDDGHDTPEQPRSRAATNLELVIEPLPECVKAVSQALGQLTAPDRPVYWSHGAAKAVIVHLNRLGFSVVETKYLNEGGG